MKKYELLRQTVALYEKHGWQLRRILATPALRQALTVEAPPAPVADHEVDALWFARPSREGREAWELRWLTPTPYALFEIFEPDEEEADREDVRLEMEARLREHACPGQPA